MNYKFKENELIEEFKEYVDKTYTEHYSKSKIQAIDIIMDNDSGTGFCMGNVIKYVTRYGKKGMPEEHRKDLMKILHYTLLQLYIHDNQ